MTIEQATTMKVRDLGTADLAGVESNASLAEAAQLMLDLDVGSAAVFDRSKLIGIITERDVMLAAIDRADFDDTTVTAFMTPRPSTIWVDADVFEAAFAMRALHTRHLPVMDGGVVVGMLSARDLLGAFDLHAEPDRLRRSRWGLPWRRWRKIAEV